MFGGIYFATTLEIAFSKAHSAGAIAEAEVMLGYSLVCRNAMPHMTYSGIWMRFCKRSGLCVKS